MLQSEVIFVPELARLMGMTEAAVRGHYYRRSGAIPKGFKLGAKLAWRRETVREFLVEKEQRAK